MKKVIIMMAILAMYLFPIHSFAQDSNDYEIIPKASNEQKVIEAVEKVGEKGGKVRDVYNEQAEELKNNIGDQMASGIMTRKTLLDYIVYGTRFLSQIGIVIGVIMIIYAGYLYASSIFSSSNISKGKSAITNAIIGVIVIAFSYAIMKLLTSAFLS